MDKVEKAEGVNHENWNAYQSHPTHAGVFLKVAEAHPLRAHTQTSNLFLLITLVTAVQPPPIITLRRIISFIRSIMTYCHPDRRHTGDFTVRRPVGHTDRCIFIHKHREKTNRRADAKLCKHPREPARSCVSSTGEREGG